MVVYHEYSLIIYTGGQPRLFTERAQCPGCGLSWCPERIFLVQYFVDVLINGIPMAKRFLTVMPRERSQL